MTLRPELPIRPSAFRHCSCQKAVLRTTFIFQCHIPCRRYAARWPFCCQAWDGPLCKVSLYPSCVADHKAFPASRNYCAQGTSEQAIQPPVLTTIFSPVGLARLGVGIHLFTPSRIRSLLAERHAQRKTEGDPIATSAAFQLALIGHPAMTICTKNNSWRRKCC